MIRCDALIVGGGPAGLAAAIALRQKGLDVLVADALRPPIDKACGEGLMPDAQKDLAALGIQVTAHDGAAFDGIAFLSGRHQAAAHFERGQRHRYPPLATPFAPGRALPGTGRATRLGQPGTRSAEQQPGAWMANPAPTATLIGADGQSSRVRQAIGLGQGKILSRRFGARCHYRVKPWCRMVEVHWGDLGQAYITPVGPEEICVATVARVPAIRMEAVLASLPALRRILKGARELSRVRGALTTTRKLRRVTAGNVALTGDASGSADAVTGEGIGLSFRQALLLAEAIAVENLAHL